MISFHTNLISCFIRGIRSFLYMILDNRLIGIRSNWEPTIQIVKLPFVSVLTVIENSRGFPETPGNPLPLFRLHE